MVEERSHEPRVTVIITPRERFGVAKESLLDLYEKTHGEFEVVYVDANGPEKLRTWLQDASQRRGFRYIRIDRYLAPNESRNIGLREATTPYVVFVDNDVMFTHGWLDALVECADETGAAIVAPLTCHGLPLHSEIHHAGGEYTPDPDRFFDTPASARSIKEVMYGHREKFDARRQDLRRRETQFCEFHCVIVRRSIFEKTGMLDEEMLATKEHLDFSMAVRQAGGSIVFEPSSIVTYLFPNRRYPIELSDWPFFSLRWSAEWQRRSLARFQQKWGLAEDEYFLERAKALNWRRDEGMVGTLVKQIPYFGRFRWCRGGIKRVTAPLERIANRVVVALNDRQRRVPA